MAALLLACVPPPFRAPGQGGPAWRELTSEHFVLATDVVGEDAEIALRDLEEHRAALIATAWPNAPAGGGRARVVILAHDNDWRSFEREHNGFFTEALFEPLIALRAEASDQTRITIRHELTHHLSRFHVRTQPRWLSEGLATFFETLSYDRDRGEILVGLPLPGRLAVLRGGFSVARTLDGTLERDESERFYATSWLMVHHFFSRQHAAFDHYMTALDSGVAEGAAWRRAFGDLTPDRLQGELRAYWGEGRPLVASQRFRAPAFTSRTRPLGDATVHAWRAMLYLRGLGKEASAAARASAHAELDAAFAADPHDELALAVRGISLEEPIAIEAARAAAARAPQSWLAQVVLYRAAGNDLVNPEARRAAATALRLTAANPALKLPFGPPQPLFSPSAPVPPCRVRDAGDRSCPRVVPRRGEEHERALRAVAGADVAWCFFEAPESKHLEVELESAGRAPTSVCVTTPDERLRTCVQKALADVSLSAQPACQRRRYELHPAPDGRVTVFAR